MTALSLPRFMRFCALAFFAALFVLPVQAQQSRAAETEAERAKRFVAFARANPDAITIVGAKTPEEMGIMCQLKVADFASGHPVGRLAGHPAETGFKRMGQVADFDVTYTGFTSDFQDSFQRAVDTWAMLLTTNTTTTVEANFRELPDGVLGSAGPGRFLGLTGGGETFFFAQPLAEDILNQELNRALLDPEDPDVPDISANFSSAFTNWFTGEGEVPLNRFDFESVVLHELTHGLHFLSFSDFDDGIVDSDGNPQECAGVANTGCIKGGTTITDIFTTFIEDGAGRLYTDLEENSTDLGTVMRNNASIFADGDDEGENATSSGRRAFEAALHAPGEWDRGSSISHLAESFNGSNDALMTFSIAPGDSERAPGTVVCGMLEVLGWGIDQPACASLSVDVEEAERVGDDRMQLAAYPAPLREAGTARLTLAAPETVHLALYDLLGREVATLHDGLLAAGSHPFAFESASWPAGLYLLRATGTAGTHSLSLLRVR